MPVISRKAVRARKRYRCAALCCKRRGLIEVGETHSRLYGMAHRGEPPYVVRLHAECDEAFMERKGESDA